jgi:hypothetical protein
VFYAPLRAFLTGCGFNEELLPSLHFVVEDLDLTKHHLPGYAKRWSQVWWCKDATLSLAEQHNRLSAAIFAVLTGRDVISMSAI